MLGNHKGSLYIGLIFVGDLYRLGIYYRGGLAIALPIRSVDLFAQLVVGFPNPSFNGRGNLASTIGHSLHVNVNRT